MRAFSAMLLAAAAMLVTGCGAQVNLFGHTVSEGRSKEKQPPESGEGPGRSGENTQTSAAGAGAEARPLFRDVLLSLNATVRKQAATDHHLDDGSLHAAIAAELRQRGLMGGLDSTDGTPVDILVDGYSLQPTGSAAAGRVPHAGRISGLVRVLDADGKEQRSFKVRAEAMVQIPAQGSAADAMNELYRRFAAMTADGLAPRAPAAKK